MLAALLAATLLVPPDGPPGELVIRRAEVSLVPPEALPLGGYTQRQGATFEPGGDKLIARCVVLELNDVKIALVTAELLTIPESLAREVKNQLPKDVRLFLNATHTHSAPDSQMLNDRMKMSVPGIASFKRRWLAWFAASISEGVKSALAAQPESLPRIRLRTMPFQYNRPRRPGARPDPYATQLESIAAFYTAHGTVFDSKERRLRGDWPGQAMLGNRELLWNGPLGDVSPIGPIEQYLAAFEKLRGALAVMMPADRLQWAEAKIELPKPTPHPEFAKAFGLPEPLAQQTVERFAPVEAVVCGFRIGDIAVLGLPAEPTAAIGRQLVATGLRLGYAKTIVVSLVNGWMGYVLAPDDYDKGGYEPRLSFFGRSAAAKLIEAGEKVLEKLKEEPGGPSR